MHKMPIAPLMYDKQCSVQAILAALQVLTLFQRGNVIVQSYPYFPDMLAVANAIASDDHATAAETLLQQGPAPLEGLNAAVEGAEASKASWLITPKQEEELLCTMNIPLMASMISEGPRL